MTDPYNPYDLNAQQPQYNNQGYGGYPSGAPMKPENYLLWTILTTIMCCLPLGAIGIYFSMQVDKNWEMGLPAEAAASARKAKLFAIASAASMGVLAVLYFVFVLIAIISEAGGTSTY